MKRDTTTVITLTNHKGGVGKTNCCIGLSYCLAQMGYEILCIDPDPQGNFTDNLNVDINCLVAQTQTLYDAMYSRQSVGESIFATEYANMDILASDPRIESKIEEQGLQMGMFVYPYRALVAEIKAMNKYDFVIIDTRPSIGAENRQIFIASDYVIIPTTTNSRSTAGIQRVLDSIERCNQGVKDCRIVPLGIVISQVDMRTSVSKQVVPALRREYPELLFSTIIPIDEKVKQAEQICEPVLKFDPKSKASLSLNEFAKEVLERLKGGRDLGKEA